MAVKSPLFHKLILQESDVFGAKAASLIAYIRYRRDGGVKIYDRPDGRWVMISLEDFAEHLQITDRAVKKIILKLIQLKALAKERIKSPSGRHANIYKIDENLLKATVRGEFSGTALAGTNTGTNGGTITGTNGGTITGTNGGTITGTNTGIKFPLSHYIYKNDIRLDDPTDHQSNLISGNASAFESNDSVSRASLGGGRAAPVVSPRVPDGDEETEDWEEIKKRAEEQFDVLRTAAPSKLGNLLEGWWENVKTIHEENPDREAEISRALAEEAALNARLYPWKNTAQPPIANTPPLRHPTPQSAARPSTHTKQSKKAAQTPLTSPHSASEAIEVVAQNILNQWKEHQERFHLPSTPNEPDITYIRLMIMSNFPNEPSVLLRYFVQSLQKDVNFTLSKLLEVESIENAYRQIKK